MVRIPVHTLEGSPQESRKALASLKEKFGKVLNIYGEMAHSPVVIEAYSGIQKAITDHGTFDARTSEAIALAVGNENSCGYCQSAHTVEARAAGWSGEETIAIRDGSLAGDAKLGALLDVARAVAGERGEVAETKWDNALNQGWTTTELAELFTHVIVNIFTNYFNHYAHTELDVPAAKGISG